MEENKKSVDGVMEKLALLTDAAESIFPNGKMYIVFELNKSDFAKVQSNFRDVDKNHKQFRVDISRTEFMFMVDESYNDEKDNTYQNP